MPTSRTPAPRVPCPLCGVVLASTSIKAHAGRRTCLERRLPELRRQRVLAAQQAKKEYDRLYAQKQREAIAILALRVIGSSPALPLRARGLADVLPAPPSPPSLTSPAMTPSSTSTTSTSEPSESASIRRGPLLSPLRSSRIRRQHEIIDITGDEEERGVPVEVTPCPICLEPLTAPVIPFSCRHTICSECISLHVGLGVALLSFFMPAIVGNPQREAGPAGKFSTARLQCRP